MDGWNFKNLGFLTWACLLHFVMFSNHIASRILSSFVKWVNSPLLSFLQQIQQSNEIMAVESCYWPWCHTKKRDGHHHCCSHMEDSTVKQLVSLWYSRPLLNNSGTSPLQLSWYQISKQVWTISDCFFYAEEQEMWSTEVRDYQWIQTYHPGMAIPS